MRAPPSHPIEPVVCADSVITVLGGLSLERFPPEERMAVATIQLQAAEEWLSAYLEDEGRRPRPARPDARTGP